MYENSWRTGNKYTIYSNISIKSLYLPPTSTQELIRLYLSCKTIKQNNYLEHYFHSSVQLSFLAVAIIMKKRYILYPLSFEKEYYEQPLLRATDITIRGGNRDYTVTVEETDILSIDVDLSSSIGMGSLKVTPKKKGETKVKVKDNITNEIVELKIKIIDSYLAYAIKESNHPALSNGTVVYLINNESKDCYFFRYSDSKNELSQNPIAKGTYDFSVKLENGFGNSSPTYAIPYLTLNYASDEQGNFTDASTPPTPHKLRFELFDGVTSVNAVINLIQRYLKVDWEQLINKALTRSDYLIIPTLKTTIDNTDYTIIGTLDTHPEIPENILE